MNLYKPVCDNFLSLCVEYPVSHGQQMLCHKPNVVFLFCSNVNITFTDQTWSVPLSIQTTDGGILSSLPLKSLSAAVLEFTVVVCDGGRELLGVED